MRLPHPQQSCAVLIGTSTYESSGWDDLPTVENNLADLANALTDPALGGLRPERCVTLSNATGPRTVYRTLQQHAANVTDTLLVYFAGHGIFDAHSGDLYLALADTHRTELSVSALNFSDIRRIFLDSKADNKILILDCCYSGRAALPYLGGHDDFALALSDGDHTAFTGALLRLIDEGMPDGPELLTFTKIYQYLRRKLTARNLPRPEQINSGNTNQLALTRNRAYELDNRDGRPRRRLGGGVGTPKSIGRYQIERKLGSGVFCVVYLACKRFKQEGRLLRKAQSPRVVHAYDIVEPKDGKPYLVMEYAVDGSVEAELERAGGQLRVGRAVRLAAEAAKAVADLHRHDILHRDVKPANVLLTKDDNGHERVLIADLGLAKRLAEASGFTQAAGTAGYLAPEQNTCNTKPVRLDTRADIYGLGALTYHLVTGRIPSGPADEITVLDDLRPNLSREAAAIVEAALRRDRERRPKSAAALAEALDAEADRLDATPLATGSRHRRQEAKRALPRALIVVGVVVIAGVAALLWPWPWNGGSTNAGIATPPTVSSSVTSATTSAPTTSTPPTSTPPPTQTPNPAPAKPDATTAPQSTTSPTPALPDQMRITHDEQLFGGQSWQTSVMTVTMTMAGALVIESSSGTQTWTSGTSGTGYRAIMQADGNLVIYDQRPFGVWSTGTAGHQGAYLQLTNHGTAEIIYQGTVLWTSESQ